MSVPRYAFNSKKSIDYKVMAPINIENEDGDIDIDLVIIPVITKKKEVKE